MEEPPSSPTAPTPPVVAAQQSPSPMKSLKNRHSYTIAEKKAIVKKVKKLMDELGYSAQKACSKAGISHSLFFKWQKPMSVATQVICMNKKKNHPGPPSTLKENQDELLKFVAEMRDTGMPINAKTVQLEAARINRSFRNKSDHAKKSIVERFLKTNLITYRKGTHESQKTLTETKNQSLDFINIIRPIVNQSNRLPRYIYNCDQSGIFFNPNINRTLEKQGSKTVFIRLSNNDTKRATLTVTICGDGHKLKPFLVFKGKPGGRIERDFTSFRADCHYGVQEKAWMDERLVHCWIEKILGPDIATAPPGIIPIVILDLYRVHLMSSVVDKIEGLGAEV